jgi:hypothetical protein
MAPYLGLLRKATFTDPTAPPEAPPRKSIDLSAFLIFGDDAKVRH